MIKVEWKTIPGFSRYEVSNKGQIRILKSKNSSGFYNIDPPRIMGLNHHRDGYRGISLIRDIDSKRIGRGVQRWMLMAFNPVDNCEVLEVRHKNGVPDDNRLSNLEWGTRKQNGEDRIKHGTSGRGENNPRATLTEFDVLGILILKLKKLSNRKIAEMFNVKISTINHISARDSWKYLSSRLDNMVEEGVIPRD
jgi:hypothetical protein